MDAATKTAREAALEKALAALLKARHPMKGEAADYLIGLIAQETQARQSGKPTNEAHRRAWHVELVRMGLPLEVLSALKGA
jgi:hypothetical protein